MATMFLAESTVEDATLAWLEELGYAVIHGPDIAAGEPAAERTAPLRSLHIYVHIISFFKPV